MNSVREALSEAFDDLSSVEEGTSTPEPSSRSSVAPITSDADKPLAPLNKSGQQDTAGADEPLDTTGADKPIVDDKPERTIWKNGEKVKLNAEPATPIVDSKVPAKVPTPSRAPQSWKPELREKFGALPPEVQAEITRREGEISRGLNESAAARRLAAEFHNTIRPFEGLMRASGVSDPLKAVNNLMNTAAALQQGTPAQKAGTVANIIKAYGIDVQVLDSILAGQVPPKGSQPDNAILQALDQRLKPVTEFMSSQQRQQQEQQRQLQEESGNTMREFAENPENEYFEDLREDMADLLESAAKRNRPMTIQEAYTKAAMSHPEISKLVKKKEELAKLTANRDKARQKQRAAISQPQGTPANVGGSATAKPAGRRAALEQAFDDLASR